MQYGHADDGRPTLTCPFCKQRWFLQSNKSREVSPALIDRAKLQIIEEHLPEHVEAMSVPQPRYCEVCALYGDHRPCYSVGCECQCSP